MVDLPAPLGPMMPRASPGWTEKVTSCTAQNSRFASASTGRRLRKRDATAGTRSRRLSCSSPRRNFFQTCWNSIRPSGTGHAPHTYSANLFSARWNTSRPTKKITTAQVTL